MKPMLLLLALATAAPAQNILMKDGKTIVTKALRRQGDQIIATVELPGGEAGKPAKTGDFGYPLAQIATLDFPEAPILRTAPDLITQGKAADALTQLEPVVTYYASFRDAPGSWWAEAMLLKSQALIALGRDKEAKPLAEQLARGAADPEIVRAAEVQLALGVVQKGPAPNTLAIAERALKESKRPGTRAAASIIKGHCMLEKKEWEEALLAFLQVPVFYPQQKVLLPQSMLGVGRAHFGMDDFVKARAALDELIETAGSLPEAALAKAELEMITRREKALAAPK